MGMTLMISSVGSLVGQNILDMVRAGSYPLRLVGLNAVAAHPRNFECDSAYLLPWLNQITPESAAEARLLAILQQEQPDLIVPARDEDVLFWAEFGARHPAWQPRILSGPAGLAALFLDKAASLDFCLQHQLPFARSLRLKDWPEQALPFDFPVLAKPAQGYGSVGVRVLFSKDELQALRQSPAAESYLLQEWLGTGLPDPPDLALGSPLFWGYLETEQYASEVLIGPTGQVLGQFSGRHHMQQGYCVYSERHTDPACQAMVSAVSQCLIAAGWRGVLNLQYKPDHTGQWRIFELNGRITGGASSRWQLGFDTLGLLLQGWCDPGLRLPAAGSYDQVFRYPRDHGLRATDLSTLESTGQWQRSC